MRCHYCDREADLAVERSGLRVGLCASHFRDRLSALADEEPPTALAAALER